MYSVVQIHKYIIITSVYNHTYIHVLFCVCLVVSSRDPSIHTMNHHPLRRSSRRERERERERERVKFKHFFSPLFLSQACSSSSSSSSSSFSSVAILFSAAAAAPFPSRVCLPCLSSLASSQYGEFPRSLRCLLQTRRCRSRWPHQWPGSCLLLPRSKPQP